MSINDHLKSLSFSPLPSFKLQAIDDVLGKQFPVMLADLKSNDTSIHKEDVRSVLMSVSDNVDVILQDLRIQSEYTSRIKIFLQQGKKLRGAFACLSKNNAPHETIIEAKSFIKYCFSQAKNNMDQVISQKVYHVYATKAAVTFEATKTQDGRSVLQVEAASRHENGKFVWKEKIAIQLNDKEIIQCISVLRNWSPLCEFSNHGSNRDKRLSFKSQEKAGYLISVRQGTTARVVPIQKIDSLPIINLCMKVLQDNTANLDTNNIFEIVRETVAN